MILPGATRADAGRILFLSANLDAPSFRYRLAPIVPLLEAMGWRCELRVLGHRYYGWRVWRQRRAIRGSSAVVLHKLRLQPWEMRWIQRLCPATLLDVDDAIWLRQSKQADQRPAASPHRLRSFAAMCATASLTLAGNEMLADRARRCGGRVCVVPTPIDVAAYPDPDPQQAPGRAIVWVGLPGNLKYLEPLRPVFARLARRLPGLVVRIISSDWPDWNDVPVQRITWSLAGEKTAIASADVGIMPLSDDEYARGKCAFKLLQYMAAGLPCIASPVGANCDVVVHGVTGLLAATDADWEAALLQLLCDPAAARRMGAAGRQRALAEYDSGIVGPRMAALVDQLGRRRSPDVPPAQGSSVLPIR
jgi:glycosyltransferase involved in cell wall biosynthesis